MQNMKAEYSSGPWLHKMEYSTGGLGPTSETGTGTNGTRRCDGHRSNKFLNEIYRVIHIRKMADNENKAPPDQKCILLKSKNQQPTAAMEPRLLHRMTQIFEKN